MIRKLLRSEEANAALVLALGMTTMLPVVKGPGPVSLERAVSRVLSKPVPRREPSDAR